MTVKFCRCEDLERERDEAKAELARFRAMDFKDLGDAIKERDEALRERNAVQEAMLGYAVFIGPCAHGDDPWYRCDECGEDNALWAATKAVTARTAERDEARAEVERLRTERSTLLCGEGCSLAGILDGQDGVSRCAEHDKRLQIALRTVAERQREACAVSLSEWIRGKNERKWTGPEAVRATPLVTEGGK